MVDPRIAVEQILRFENYVGFPAGPNRTGDRKELIDSFKDAAIDAAHAKAIGDWLIRKRPVEQCRFCPMPAEVYAAADATRPETVVDSADYETAKRQPGDQDFHGFSDLIDDRFLEIMRRKAEHGKTHLERVAAKQILEQYGKKEAIN